MLRKGLKDAHDSVTLYRDEKVRYCVVTGAHRPTLNLTSAFISV